MCMYINAQKKVSNLKYSTIIYGWLPVWIYVIGENKKETVPTKS